MNDIQELLILISKLEKQLSKYKWIDVLDKLPKYDGEYETTVVTRYGFNDIQPGVYINVRLIYVNGVWKNMYFQEVPYYEVIAWKCIDEVYRRN